MPAHLIKIWKKGFGRLCVRPWSYVDLRKSSVVCPTAVVCMTLKRDWSCVDPRKSLVVCSTVVVYTMTCMHILDFCASAKQRRKINKFNVLWRTQTLLCTFLSLFVFCKTTDYCLDDCFAGCENIVWISFNTMYGKLLPHP